MPAENHPEARRPDGIEFAAEAIADRWTLLILRESFYGVRRYGEMVRNLGIARPILATRLKRLVADGLLERRRYRTDPDWYEYVLTPAGHDLYGAIAALLRWADVHRPSETGRLHLKHKPCGHETYAKVVCAACGEELASRDVEFEATDTA